MKKLFKVFASAFVGVLALGISSCAPSGGSTLVLTPPTLAFEATAGVKYVTVTGAEWTATVNQSWVTITPTSGTDGVITVSVTANDSGADRFATLTVTNAAGSQTVSIEQAVPGQVILNPESLEFPFEGSTQTVAVASETDWTVSSDQTWLTVTKTGADAFTATATANDGITRTANITVTNAVGPKTMEVTQSYDRGEILLFENVRYYGDGNFYPFVLSSYVPGAGGYDMLLDVYSSPVDETQRVYNIPEGTYTVAGNFSPMTIYPGYSRFDKVNPDDTYTRPSIVSGTMDVTGDFSSGYIIMINFELNDGTTFKGSYEGTINPMLSDFNEDQTLGTIPMVGGMTRIANPFPTIPETKTVYITRGYSSGVTIVDGSYIGNGWIVGNIQFHSADEGMSLPNATYNIADSNSPGDVLAGYINSSNALAGLWIRQMVNDAIPEVNGLAALKSGTVASTFSGGNYTLVINGIDDSGYNFTATLTGSATAAPQPLGSASFKGLPYTWNPNAVDQAVVRAEKGTIGFAR